ncbi:hypothetical protein ACFLU9_01735 [Chloroflexota bacterium]
MNRPRTKVILVFMATLLFISSLAISCTPGRGFDNRLRSIIRPYSFSILKWELDTILKEVRKTTEDRQKEIDNEVGKVEEYFSSVKRIKSLKSDIAAIKSGNKQGDAVSLEAELNRLQQQNLAIAEIVEKTVEKQIREVLSQQRIFNPIYKYLRLEIGFPPLNFKLGEPPNLLVVSPRDRIESLREATLQPNISLEDIENLEAEVDELGVSSLIVGLGGFAGTYPSFVTNEADLQFTIDSAAEEWLHQYLAFKPLGFRYLLDLSGVSRNYEIATINETVAGMVSKEIGSIAYKKYYSQYENGDTQPQATESGFDFNREMREIRKAVDEYLARGELEQAEAFMEQKRQYLSANGYYIRKLNQAYFAFYGTYADRPTSISPIGVELKKLRSQSDSLRDFLETAAALTSRQDLTYILE